MAEEVIYKQKQMNEFITNTFNYFNGRINIFQKARLIINWCNMEYSCTGGLTTNPNTVIIYPNVILRYSSNEYDFCANLILVIIHELYHIDQFIIFDLMKCDKSYHDMIENSVEINSASYLYNHINEINKVLNLDIILYNKEVDEYIYNFVGPNIYYHRKKYAEHLISVFMDMVLLSEYEFIKDEVFTFMNDPESLIKISINGNELIIKDRAFIQDLNILNDYLYYNYYNKGYMINKSFETVQCGDNGVCFKIECETKYYIGTAVK